jgi:uncharacterized glyoxalase superfamily protein PhnB
MKLGATLYVVNSSDAVEFYLKAFKLALGNNEKNPDGSYLHAALLKNGNEVFAVSESKDFKIRKDMIGAQWPTMSYGIDFESEKEVEGAYQIIKVHGHVLREIGPLPWSLLSADVVDKFGIYWYLYLPLRSDNRDPGGMNEN